jgi:hypothetical protein
MVNQERVQSLEPSAERIVRRDSHHIGFANDDEFRGPEPDGLVVERN